MLGIYPGIDRLEEEVKVVVSLYPQTWAHLSILPSSSLDDEASTAFTRIATKISNCRTNVQLPTLPLMPDLSLLS